MRSTPVWCATVRRLFARAAHSAARRMARANESAAGSGSAPLLSRLRWIRDRHKRSCRVHETIRAATVMERFRERAENHREAMRCLVFWFALCLALTLAAADKPNIKTTAGELVIDPP